MNKKAISLFVIVAVVALLVLLQMCSSPIEMMDGSRLYPGGYDHAHIKKWISDHAKGDDKKSQALNKLSLAYKFLLENPDKPQDTLKKINVGLQCYSLAFPEDEVDDIALREQLASEIFNTVQKSKIRLDWYNSIRGQVIQPGFFDKWEGNCD